MAPLREHRARRPERRGGSHGTGVFGTSFGFTVFLVFLLFAVQVIFGLYTRTTVTAVATDLARRAATDGDLLDPARLASYAADGSARLGEYGDDVVFSVSLVDADADGTEDTVAVRADAELPTMLPVRWSGSSPSSFTRTVRARIERVQEHRP